MRNITIDGVFHARAFGGSVAAPVWRAFMEIVVEDLPVQDFPPDPEGTNVFYQTPRIAVPDVIGMSFDDAEEELREAGLNVSVNMVNSTQPTNQVVASTPPPGARVPQGSSVQLEVSNGRNPEATMPNVVGFGRDAAVAVLETLRTSTGIEFSWSFAEVPVGDATLDGIVARTSPQPGANISRDTVITITVNRFDANLTTTTTAAGG
jgi:beta-lactam-binding protein with PASTA domain